MREEFARNFRGFDQYLLGRLRSMCQAMRGFTMILIEPEEEGSIGEESAIECIHNLWRSRTGETLYR